MTEVARREPGPVVEVVERSSDRGVLVQFQRGRGRLIPPVIEDPGDIDPVDLPAISLILPQPALPRIADDQWAIDQQWD